MRLRLSRKSCGIESSSMQKVLRFIGPRRSMSAGIAELMIFHPVRCPASTPHCDRRGAEPIIPIILFRSILSANV